MKAQNAKSITLVVFLFLVSLFFSSVAYAIDFHVAPNGNDKNTGTYESPFVSINAARDALCISGCLGKEPCTIIIHAGVYRIENPILFRPEDGGSEAFPVVYRAASNEKVILTGAHLVTSPWKEWKNGIYRAQIGTMDAIDQLFVGGQRQTMARYPNDGAGFVLSENNKLERFSVAGHPPYDGCTPDAWDAGKASGWKNPEGAFLHGMHQGLWGSQHYRVLGKKANGELNYEGGWQNNRVSPAHKAYRMIENVFEELDAPGEWFHDTKQGWLYYKPMPGIDISYAQFEAVLQIKHLVEIYGDVKTPVDEFDIIDSGNGLSVTKVRNYETVKPVKNIKIEGIRFTGTSRTFMETIEPLLRSDWCVYRGGAIHLRGTENVCIENCTFEELGGNAVFVDGYNRRVVIRGNRFNNNGATDVNFVGAFSAVRDPEFNYNATPRKIEEVDNIIGPKSDEYPADCVVEDNLMTRCGRFEKQSGGVNISMSSRITARHNTISHTPRAAINICDGTWGGHIIEWNDCFETVLETRDHGAFNSWGRDRYWHSASPSGPNQKDDQGTPLISHWINKDPNSPRWDAYQTTIIRNNRMQCDHGWDIDLDDGSTNYKIYNNLCLSGGLKTREGYFRIVTNNIILGRGYTCNVPYPKPTHDVFERNILWGKVYSASNPLLWGGRRNNNFIHNPDFGETVSATGVQEQTQDDAGSLYGNASLVAPEQGDFSVMNDSPALEVGFKNFPMTGFGVISTRLKELAPSPTIRLPKTAEPNLFIDTKTRNLLGAQIKSLRTMEEITATGMFSKIGVLLFTVPPKSKMAQLGFRADDVVLEIDGEKISKDYIFIEFMSGLKKGKYKAKVWRGQKTYIFTFSY